MNAGPITYFLRLVSSSRSSSATVPPSVMTSSMWSMAESIEGTVTLEGAVPEPKGFNLITFPDPQYCGRISNGKGWRLLHDFVVGPKAG